MDADDVSAVEDGAALSALECRNAVEPISHDEIAALHRGDVVRVTVAGARECYSKQSLC